MGKFPIRGSISKKWYLSTPEHHARNPMYRSDRVCSLHPERGGLAFGGFSVLLLLFLFRVGFSASLQLPPACTCTGNGAFKPPGDVISKDGVVRSRPPWNGDEFIRG